MIACIDGLSGFPHAIETVFPKTQVQLCIVHMVRNSVAFVPWQQQFGKLTDHASKVVLTSRRFMRRQRNQKRSLILKSKKWDKQYPSISKSWRSHWANIIPFFAFPPEIRRAIYTTNAIESMNSSLRKVIKSQQIFPSVVISELVELMTLLSSWFIWRCGISRRSGRCQFAIGSLHSIALLFSSRIVSISSF